MRKALTHDAEDGTSTPMLLAREICHGKKGTIHQAYRDGMEDQLGSLGLVLNAVVLCYLGRPEAVRYAA